MRKLETETAVMNAVQRLAVFFQCQHRTFTGPEIAGILLSAWHRYEQEKTVRTENAQPKQGAA